MPIRISILFLFYALTILTTPTTLILFFCTNFLDLLNIEKQRKPQNVEDLDFSFDQIMKFFPHKRHAAYLLQNLKFCIGKVILAKL